MKDTVSTDAAAVGQYKIGQVMYPGTPTPPTHPSTANHQRPPTRVAMAARPHPRRKFCARTSCLPPPGPPPSIQTPPRPSKEINFEPQGLPRPTPIPKIELSPGATRRIKGTATEPS